MSTYTYDIQDYLRIARERWKTILFITLIVLLASIGVTAAGLPGPAGVDVAVPDGAPSPTIDLGVSPTPTPTSSDEVIVVRIFASSIGESLNVEGERLVALSERVLAEPAQNLDLDVDRLAKAVEVTPLPNANSLVITANGVANVSGRQLARAVAESYLKHSSAAIRRTTEAAAEALEKQLDLVRDQEGSDTGSLVASLRIAALQSELARVQSAAASAEAGEILESAGYQGLAPTPTSSPALTAPPPVTDPAAENPTSETAAGRPWTRNVLAGLVLGLLVGYAIALLFDLLNPRFRSPREARELLELPILTKIDRPDTGEGVGELTAQMENGLRERGRSSLAWVEVGGKSKDVFDAVTALLSSGGAAVETVEAGTGPAGDSRARAEEALKNMPSGCDAVLVRAGADAPSRSSLAWAGACETAVVAVDLSGATREEVQQEVDNLRRAGTEPLGLLLLA